MPGQAKSASDQPELEFTGERFTPECVREIFYEHWHRYAWARDLVTGRTVLDAACGEGYGSRLLAETAGHVIGVDMDRASIEHAGRRYQASNLEFRAADCTRLPFDDDSFDAVVSFETLEHLDAQDRLLAEFRRVLRPDGFLLLSSPDRRTYSDETGFSNEFHVRELYRDELETLVSRHFPAWRMLGQKLLFLSAIWDLEAQGPPEYLVSDDAGAVARARRPQWPPLYFLVVAAAAEGLLPVPPGVSLFGDRAESVYAHYNEEVGKHIRAGELLAERDAEIRRLRDRRTWWQRLLGRSRKPG